MTNGEQKKKKFNRFDVSSNIPLTLIYLLFQQPAPLPIIYNNYYFRFVSRMKRSKEKPKLEKKRKERKENYEEEVEDRISSPTPNKIKKKFTGQQLRISFCGKEEEDDPEFSIPTTSDELDKEDGEDGPEEEEEYREGEESNPESVEKEQTDQELYDLFEVFIILRININDNYSQTGYFLFIIIVWI